MLSRLSGHDRSVFSNAGFTLLEMTIVVLILGLLMGGLLVPLSVQREGRERAETWETLEEIEEALYGFALVNGRLPCPDSDGDGSEDRNDTDTGCEADVVGGTFPGTLPSADLGVRRLDAWGQPVGYHVTDVFANGVFSLNDTGRLEVRESAEDGASAVATELPVIVISRGSNWAVSSSNHELANDDAFDTEATSVQRRTYVYRNYSRDEDTEFDDLLIWLSPHVLMNRMLAAGKLP